MILPPEAHPLVQVLALHFTNPTYQRFSALLVGAVLTTGRRTAANLLRTLRQLAPGHPTDYRRALSRAPWSGLTLGCALARFLLDHLVPDGPVYWVGDDTVDGHPGRTVYGKARHRDPARSSHAYTAWRYGHKWVVLAVLVKLPFAARRWARPVLVDRDRPPDLDRAEGRPHKTPAQLMGRLWRRLLIRFPGRTFGFTGDSSYGTGRGRRAGRTRRRRTFGFTGDSSYGTHAVARFCHRHRGRLTRVSKLCPDANLFAPPPPYRGNGRPRVKGERVPKPRQAAAPAPRTKLTVVWYGGGARRVEAATGTGHGYKGGCGLVPVRWVFVKDATGTHRDESLFTTDVERSPDAVVGTYCGRWSVETTFREARSALGLETTRGRCRATVLRAAPCRFGLYTVVAVLFAALPESKRTGAVVWPGKATVTFSDALCAVRRWRWAEAVLPQAGDGTALQKLPEPVRELLLTTLAPAA